MNLFSGLPTSSPDGQPQAETAAVGCGGEAVLHVARQVRQDRPVLPDQFADLFRRFQPDLLGLLLHLE